MRIYGVGTDIVKCDRIAKAWANHSQAFARRILTADEFAALSNMNVNQAAFLAKRFAAKEAVVKALGTGFRDDVMLTQIGIDTDELGKPHVTFYGSTKAYVESLGEFEIQISIADEVEYVVAFAVASVDDALMK